jgi:hypothetical protein
MQYEQALALFKGRFFPSEEGGITPGQVLFEIGLLQAEAWAKARNCAQADDFLAGKQPGMSLDGRSARDDVKLAGIARGCGHAKESEDLLHKAAARADSADLVWAIQAEKSLGTYDARADQRIATSMATAESRAATGVNSGSLWYEIGMLQTALNRQEQARESFEKVLLLPDTHMFHHLAREALAELSARK